MTTSELKRQYKSNNPEGCFFDRESMRFFGDTMSNYGVRDAEAIKDYHGETFDCWELYRKHPVKHGLKSSTYFTKDTLHFICKKD